MNNQRPKIGVITEAIAEAHEEVGVDYEPRSLFGVAGLAAAGHATLDDVIGGVMRAHPNLDAALQCKLADRINRRLIFATAGVTGSRTRTLSSRQAARSTESYPSRRPRDAVMTYNGVADRILSVGGRRVGGR